MPLPYEWNNRKIQAPLKKNTLQIQTNLMQQKWERLNFIEHLLHLFACCISARILFVVSGIILSSKQLFYIKKWFFSFKSKYHAEKWKWGLPLKDVLHLSTHYSFLQEYSLLFKEYMSCLQGRLQPGSSMFLQE